METTNLPTVLNPNKDEFETLQRICKTAVLSTLLPDAYNTGDSNAKLAKAIVIALKGRELGIPMMQAFSQINIIKGKPTISAELMLALIFKKFPEAPIHVTEYSNTKCTIEASRPGSDKKTIFTFTIDDAKQAGLGGVAWQKYPRAMLRSRCISEMARTMFPDCLMGCSYTPEEIGADVDIDDDGDVIVVNNVQSVQPVQKKEVTGNTEGYDKRHETKMNEPCTQAQIDRFFRRTAKAGWKELEALKWLEDKHGFTTFKSLSKQRFQDIDKSLTEQGIPE